jgi:alpha-beta hydrolase superfamily lysophospholipase
LANYLPVRKHVMISLIKHIIIALFYGIAGGLIVLVIIFVLFLESRHELKVWHQVELDAEFTAVSPVRSFEDYLSLERKLFAQLDERVFTRVPAKDRNLINRYSRGSLSDPGRWTPNWNRTFEFSTDAPKAGVLLLHGMSDSPYSLISLGRRLHSEGAWVIGLRLPGHGTAPSGLVQVQWEDMAAAVRLAMRHLSTKVGKQPLYLVGYSNGGALAVHYVLSGMEDSTLPMVSGMVLISPSIGVRPIAALAKWQAKLGRFLGLKKLEWNSILPEYDPFKYNSFAVNAGEQVYRITNEIRSRIESLGAAGKLNRFPPVLAFQSIVDATVSTRAVVDGLFAKLPAGGHELVLFDINRLSEVEHVLIKDPKSSIEAKFKDPGLPFAISLVTNAREDSRDIVVLQKKPGDSQITRKPLDMKWPFNLYSLSHVALPFSMNDPLYGMIDSNDHSKIQLGNMNLRGERGVLQIPAEDMIRLRWNPFYSYLERRILEFVRLAKPENKAVLAK